MVERKREIGANEQGPRSGVTAPCVWGDVRAVKVAAANAGHVDNHLVDNGL